MNLKSFIFFILIICFSLASFSNNHLDLILKISKSESVKQSVKEKLDVFYKKNVSLKNLNDLARYKKLKVLIKKNFCRIINKDADFIDLFNNQYYNNLSYISIASLVFDEFNIPYIIGVSSGKFYARAFPDSHDIFIQIKDKRSESVQWTYSSKEGVMNFLVFNDIIRKSKIERDGFDAIIRSFNVSNSQLDFEYIVGIHLFNKAIQQYENGSAKKAYGTLKSSLLHTNYKPVKYFLGSITSNLIDKVRHSDVTVIDYITTLYQLSENLSNKDNLHANYQYYIHQALMEREDTTFINETYNIVNKNIENIEDKNRFISDIELIKTYKYFNEGKYSMALKYCIAGYKLDQKNKKYSDILPSLILKKLENEIDLFYLEFDDIDTVINHYYDKYSFLNEMENYHFLPILMYAFSISELFIDDEEKDGQACIAKLEALIDISNIREIDLISEAIGNSYGEVAAFYFREEDLEKSLSYINKALEFDPNSKSNKRKKKYIMLYIDNEDISDDLDDKIDEEFFD